MQNKLANLYKLYTCIKKIVIVKQSNFVIIVGCENCCTLTKAKKNNLLKLLIQKLVIKQCSFFCNKTGGHNTN